MLNGQVEHHRGEGDRGRAIENRPSDADRGDDAEEVRRPRDEDEGPEMRRIDDFATECRPEPETEPDQERAMQRDDGPGRGLTHLRERDDGCQCAGERQGLSPLRSRSAGAQRRKRHQGGRREKGTRIDDLEARDLCGRHPRVDRRQKTEDRRFEGGDAQHIPHR